MRTFRIGLVLLVGCAQAPVSMLERAATFPPLGPNEWPRQEHVLCPDGSCTLATNEGCGVGESCLPTSLDALEATLACFPTSEPLPFCCTAGSRDECGPNAICALPISSQPPFVALACLETAECDPIDGSGCDPGMACLFAYAYGGFTYCRPAGTGGVGTMCESRSDCQSGLTCSANLITEERKCRRYCELSSGRGCSGTQECQPFFKGELKYGYCT